MYDKTTKVNGFPQFVGPFAELLIQYINYKRAQGYKLHDPIIYRLREMDLFFRDMGITEIQITRAMYDAWTCPKPPEKETTTQKRRTAIRGFARYLVSIGYEDIYTGFDDARVFKSDFIPYVFSKDEIRRMFHVIECSCRDDAGYENDCFRISMMLYYCCGFRKSEAQNLTVDDVNLDTGKITILHGKNDVSRIVVVSDSLLSFLKEYSMKYLQSTEPGTYFLYPKNARSQCERRIYCGFRRLLTEASVPPKADGGKQRLHDVRHTFCVRALEQMQEKGFDLYTSLPLLSRYLGHRHITETEYYLRLMEEHFGGILDRSSVCHPGIFPHCEGGDADE